MDVFRFLYMNVEALERRARLVTFKQKFRFKIANSEDVKGGREVKCSEVNQASPYHRPRRGKERYRYSSTLSLTSRIDGIVSQRLAPATLTPERLGTHCTGDSTGCRPIWMGAEYLAPTAIQSPDRSARSRSPYRLRYLGALTHSTVNSKG